MFEKLDYWGEPLMYKKVDEVVQHVLKYKNFDQLKINTNGTIIPKTKNLRYFKIKEYFSTFQIMEKPLGMLMV